VYGPIDETHSGQCDYCQWTIGLTFRQQCPDALTAAAFKGLEKNAGAFEFHLVEDGCARCFLLLESRAIAMLAELLRAKTAALTAAEAAGREVEEARQQYLAAWAAAREFARNVITLSIPLPHIEPTAAGAGTWKGIGDASLDSTHSSTATGAGAEARVDHHGAQVDFSVRATAGLAHHGELVIPNLRIARSFTLEQDGSAEIRLHIDELEEVDSTYALVVLTPGADKLV
jgi:hypothetical protein